MILPLLAQDPCSFWRFMLYSSVFQMYSSVSPMIYGLPFWHYFFRYAHNLGIHINIFGHCFAITKTPKTQIILLGNSAAHFIFFTLFSHFFFICFHNKNQLTFFIFFLTIQLKTVVEGLSEEKGLFGLYIHKYFILCHNFVILLAFTISKSKHKREHKQRF